MQPDMVDATLLKRKYGDQEETPDSTTTISDEELSDNLEIEGMDLNNSELDYSLIDHFKQFETKSYVYENNNLHTFDENKVNMYREATKSPGVRFREVDTNDGDFFKDKIQEVTLKMNYSETEKKPPVQMAPNQVSVIKRTPASSNQEAFPASFTNTLVPFKKRESAKEWIPYCQKLSLSLQGSPSFTLSSEESLFIDQRVAETKALVHLLHENCVKYLDEKEAYKSFFGLDLEKEHCIEIFRAKAGEIFSNPVSLNENQSVEEIYNTNLIKSRFLCCAMAALAVRLFGGPEVDCSPHDHFFYQKYSFLLKSPWASSLEQEREVVNTLRLLGTTIRSDKRLEVLFTSAIMRGFRDISQPAQTSLDGDLTSVQKPLASRLPDLLTGTQFSLLLFRYLKETRSQAEALSIFQNLESLIQPLYVATNTFYYERLKF